MFSGLCSLSVAVPVMKLKTTKISVDISVRNLMPIEIKWRKCGNLSFNPSRALWPAVWQRCSCKAFPSQPATPTSLKPGNRYGKCGWEYIGACRGSSWRRSAPSVAHVSKEMWGNSYRNAFRPLVQHGRHQTDFRKIRFCSTIFCKERLYRIAQKSQ